MRYRSHSHNVGSCGTLPCQTLEVTTSPEGAVGICFWRTATNRLALPGWCLRAGPPEASLFPRAGGSAACPARKRVSGPEVRCPPPSHPCTGWGRAWATFCPDSLLCTATAAVAKRIILGKSRESAASETVRLNFALRPSRRTVKSQPRPLFTHRALSCPKKKTCKDDLSHAPLRADAPNIAATQKKCICGADSDVCRCAHPCRIV